jgi:hypothetical protein
MRQATCEATAATGYIRGPVKAEVGRGKDGDGSVGALADGTHV